MSTDSPNSFEPLPPDGVVKMRRWPLYAVICAGLLLVGVLVYSVNFAHNPEEEAAQTQKVDIKEQENPLIAGEGNGLALPPAGSQGLATPQAVVSGKPEPLIVVRDDGQKPADQQERDNIRRMRSQAYLSALSSPLAVKKASVTAGGAPAQSSSPEPVGREQGNGIDASALRDNGYDPAANKDKEAFFDRSSARDSAWILPHSRTPGQPLEIKTGAVIPGVMLTGINSDLPGTIIAQVSQNVFDTGTGQQLLIPRGAKLYGVYDSRVVYGQERVLVAWNRLIFPDGSAVTLGAMPGADMSGYAGYTDGINNHYLRIFGSAAIMSLVTGGMAYTMDSMGGDNGGNNNNPTLQDEMGSALAAQMGQASIQLLQKNLNITPTLEIRPGYQFNLVVTKDLVFQHPYNLK